VKNVRSVAIADHLWDALGRMAEEMGGDRDALLNQAIHVFARLNGYVVPGAVAASAARAHAPAPVPVTAPPAPPPRPERAAAQEQVLEAAARLERDLHAPSAGAARLVVVREDGTEEAISKERFIVGRGRHCDLVVDSPKVSREHAAIVREGDGWFIEDLGSSNGTWLRRERITRRRVEDGDEYFISAERLRCALR
jgi:hypothetical protein